MAFARLRSRYLAAMGLCACTRGQPSIGPGDMTANGFVAVPMAMADAGATPDGASHGDAESAARRASRPLPAEPSPPPGTRGCVREPTCREAEDEAPPLPFPEPFERCAPTFGKGGSAAFSVHDTKEARQADPGVCCYVEYRECGPVSRPFLGRPLRATNGAHLFAQDEARRDWEIDFGGVRAHVPAADRARMARRWREDAAREHASVASFARFALQLLALGAPADLVRDAHRAALDEIAHAKVSYAIAAALDGAHRGPGALPTDAVSFATSLASFAAETLRDGCIEETRAAVVARDRAEKEPDPAVRAALLTIADDEEAHAELAWRAVAWAVRTGNEEVGACIRAALDALAQDRSALHVEVIRPCAEALLA